MLDSSQLVARIGPLVDTEDYFLWEYENAAVLALGAAARISVCGDLVTLTGQAPVQTTDPFATVPEILDRSFPSGWRAFGYIAFDACRFYQPYSRSAGVPALELVIPRSTVSLRGEQGEHVTITASKDERARIKRLMANVQVNPLPPPSPAAVAHVEDGRAEYLAAIGESLAAVNQGLIDKVILSRHISLPGRLDALSTYGNSSTTRAARRFAFQLGKVRGAGVCPDMLLAANPQRSVTTSPLAGTRFRGATPEMDATRIRELLSDPKELSEHALSIRCAYEELAEVCTKDTLRIVDFMRVKTFPFTHHLASRAAGTLAPGKTAWDALRAVFPGVTVTGIAKSAAIALIDRLEQKARGVYGGTVGCVDSLGAMDWGIAIRSVFEVAGRVSISAGAGIVRDSDPAIEFDESVHKMRTIAARLVLQESER